MNNFFQLGAIKKSSVEPEHEEQPWIEKYRPKSMDDISSQEQTVAVLKKTIESRNLPHLLFYGPAGTGKTSAILALSRELYGPQLIKSRVLELNASDERGIQVIREKVKNFAKVTVSNPVSGYPCPPYKIIILDEADSMTQDAQAALRRTMESYSKITRFCLICNYISRIIEPLASRCAKFRFKPLDVNSAKQRIETICQREGINCSPEAVDEIISDSEGDLRKAIMYLQSAYRLHKNDLITKESVREIAGVVPSDIIDELVASMFADTHENIENMVERIVSCGFSATQILSQLNDNIVKNDQIGQKEKSIIAHYLGETDKCLVDGADEHLQILRLALQIAEIIRESRNMDIQ